jgi:dTDP-4-dehydrorhamnose reductase
VPDGLPARSRVIGGVDVVAFDTVEAVLTPLTPSVVVNCIGVVKQLKQDSALPSLLVNAVFPHRLAAWCRYHGARLIHFSTDCVFAGRHGRYLETDTPDADDLYGRTKLLGEVAGPGLLTLRTALIGRELSRPTRGLLEWFLAASGTVHGFRRAVFSGVTTRTAARLVCALIDRHPRLDGLYHVGGDAISKFELLSALKVALKHQVDIEPVDVPSIDRSLDAQRFVQATGLTIPSWSEMIDDLAAGDFTARTTPATGR